MSINRNNYEEYFILYLDNELSSEERREVELFIQENPDLQAELDIFLQSKLPAEELPLFDAKETLLAREGAIGINSYEEWMLLSVDGELTGAQQAALDQFLAKHPAAMKEMAWLQKTRLSADTGIAFPDKDLLYRKEEKKASIIAIRWMRIAVAAVLLLAVGTTAVVVINNNNKPDTGDGAIASTEGKKAASSTVTIQQGTPVTVPSGADHPAGEDQAVTAHVSGSSPDEHTVPGKTPAPALQATTTESNQGSPSLAAADPAKKQDNGLPSPVKNPNYSTDNPNEITRSNESNAPVLASASSKNNDLAVTDNSLQPSYISHANSLEDVMDEQAASGRKNKLRGFFRKVTRTFEKKTNIDVTDGDDQLLLAGFAIKM